MLHVTSSTTQAEREEITRECDVVSPSRTMSHTVCGNFGGRIEGSVEAHDDPTKFWTSRQRFPELRVHIRIGHFHYPQETGLLGPLDHRQTKCASKLVADWMKSDPNVAYSGGKWGTRHHVRLPMYARTSTVREYTAQRAKGIPFARTNASSTVRVLV